MPTLKELIPFFERLTGRTTPCKLPDDVNIQLFEDGKDIGFSQFNEILLLLGFDRINEIFFQYIAYGYGKYDSTSAISSISQLKEGIDRFLKLALLHYGNIKFAYNVLVENSDELVQRIFETMPNPIHYFRNRHDPLIPILPIESEKTYLLGYLIDYQINEKLRSNPSDNEALRLKEERAITLEKGIHNQRAYLASDHLDVYVATSMRKKHEFVSISNVVNQIFLSDELLDLKLRWFDPTQAYCEDRIDKGLSEALMLKRASCTLYLAQETDTLGKDSELASTLAQGKPVIAYVPKGDKEFVDNVIDSIHKHEPHKDLREIILDQIRIYAPELPWEDSEIREWINDFKSAEILELKNKLYTLAERYYDTRAKNLKENHPLGIQVELKSGVANGVLVVRSIDNCIKLIHNIILNELEFDLKENDIFDTNCNVYLIEKISGSIFRIKTSNTLLTNAFWNFYL